MIPYLIKYKKLSFPKNDFNLQFINLLNRMLDKNPYTRITMREVLKNDWVNNGFRSLTYELGIEEEFQSEFDLSPIAYSLFTIIIVVLFIVKLKILSKKNLFRNQQKLSIQ